MKEATYLEKVVSALEDAADFIAAIHEATKGAADIDKNSILRRGQRLQTTARNLDAKLKKILAKA